ncbi:thioester reductase domain-containing protein [Tsukamurella sp. 8F]|uniref:thioester reductase domain-containing protein n=1 Tax=unclassified Tsukamurella TaxID=2633480 RepID=UPI0023B9A905|nr:MULTISPECIES: thioester reductase domain-containing protein [unclassified Tsukamurella]MDF0530798.1 thioester reductase domain-containing protein [Tsukamurella sp. 8J]MDF0588324.1 thioester reductase domain-containing protein [Tsukamurella sp. 8F]
MTEPEMTVDELLALADGTRPEPADPSGSPRVVGMDPAGIEAALIRAAGRMAARPVGSDTDLFDAGLTSAQAVELVAELEHELGSELDLGAVFADPRPSAIARAVGSPGESAGDELALVRADLRRADELPFVGPPRTDEPRCLLLTGATGFVGVHVLAELLRRSDAHVVCLARAADDAAALARIATAAKEYGVPWNTEVRRRVTAVAGDLAAPRLGLDDVRWQALAAEVDGVVSVGAEVDFVRGYRSLGGANVAGPLSLAELASVGPVPLHHVSSLGAFNQIGIEAMDEDGPLARVDRLGSGYDRSKWASDVALQRARDHGLVVTLLRPGGIGGNRSTGAHNAHDLSSAITAALTRYRTIPAFRCLNTAPVDWVARLTAAAVLDPGSWGGNYHLVGEPVTLDDLVRGLTLAGMAPTVQPWDEWRSGILERIDGVAELAFLATMLRSPSACALAQASLSVPAAGTARARELAVRHGIEPAPGFDVSAQLRTLTAMDRTGLARLPGRDSTPHVAFDETLTGAVDSRPCTIALTLSAAGMHQLLTERRLDVRGTVECDLLPGGALTVSGDLVIRPDGGVPVDAAELRHPLMEYRLAGTDGTGTDWTVVAHKTARLGRDIASQTRTATVELTSAAEAYSGTVSFAPRDYLRDGVDGLRIDPALSARERRQAKAVWFAWFGGQVGRGLLQPALRAFAELWDLRGARDDGGSRQWQRGLR